MTVRVLIADAHITPTGTYRDHLAALGYEVVVAHDGLECLRALRQFVPGVLVLGTSLPWGCCDGVLACLDAEVNIPRPIVIVLASECDSGLLYRLAALGVDYFESMPVTPRRLQIVMEETLARGQRGLFFASVAEPHCSHGPLWTDRTR